MIVKDMFEKVLFESGHFLIKKDNLEINLDNFEIIVKSALGIFNKYCPIDRHYNKDIDGLSYTFLEDIPEWISDVIPVRIGGIMPYMFRDKDMFEIVKQQYPWEYRKPTLYVPIAATYDIHAVYHHVLADKDVTTISEKDDEFFDILTGKFLIALGKSRRAFTMTDIPIEMDSAELVSEGNEIIEKAEEKLTENEQKWYLAWP